MKKVSFFLILLIFSVLTCVPFVKADEEGFSHAIGAEDQYQALKDREQKKTELEQKIKTAKQQEKTLNNQINYLEDQISLTSLQQEDTRYRIEVAQTQLEDVNGDIDNVGEKLDNMQESIGSLYGVLAARIRAEYQIESGTVGYVFDSDNFQQMVLQSVYLNELQKEDNKLLAQMKGLKDTYEKQKSELEKLKEEKEKLKAQLESQSQILEDQKVDYNRQQSAKSWLLGVTKNEEKKYQVLLAQVQEEINAIKIALTSLGTRLGEVKKGDVIAHVGNTGCSTGPHLHFGYYINGVAVDPIDRLNSGSFGWPLANPQVSQGFNDPSTKAWYQSNFGIEGHNGIDMVDSLIGPGAPILAAGDGIAYRVNDSQACWLTGTVGQGIRIDHPDGTKTIYWHVAL